MIQPMAMLVTLLEQHSVRQPPTVATQATTTTWWETLVTTCLATGVWSGSVPTCQGMYSNVSITMY